MSAPAVELRFNPTDLRPRDLPSAGAFLGSPAEALEASLSVARAAMVAQMKAEVRGLAEPTHAQLIRIADLAWQAVFWRYRKLSAPVLADAYLHAYQRADAGDVPIQVIYDLADKHAEKIGDYFHTSSREALAEGFSTMVNRRVPAKVAADKVLDAYGLAPRQMRGYVTNKQFAVPVDSPVPRSIKAKARQYVERAFTQRTRKLAKQEEHNIDQQAQQFAWMWMQDKGRLSAKAQKIWITAHDERVCPVCGPLHGQKVLVGEQFKTKEGHFWTPGLHPNCRCVVRLLENRFAKGVFAKAGFDPRLHPRGGDPENKGRFSRRSVSYKEPEADIANLNRFLAEAEALHERDKEPEKIGLDDDLISAGDKIGTDSLIGLDRKIGLEGKIGVDAESIGVDQPKISRTEIADKIRLTPEAKLLAVAQTEKLMAEALPTYERPKAKEKKLYYKPTVFVHDVTGKQQPYFAVVEEDTPYDGTYFQLNHDIHFIPNLAAISNDVVELREEKILNAIDQVVNDATEDPIVWHPTEDSYFSASLDAGDLAGPIRWLANGARPTDDYTQSVVWVDRSGGEHTQTHKYSEIISMMKHRAKNLDLQVQVMRLDEAHDSWKGQTVHRTAGAHQGRESWITDGIYSVKKKTRMTVHSEPGRKIGTTILSLDPDVEEVELPSMFSGE